MSEDAAKRAKLSEIADYLDGKTTLGWDTPKGQHYRAIYAQTLRAIDAAIDAAVAEALKDTINLDAHEDRVDAAVAAAVTRQQIADAHAWNQRLTGGLSSPEGPK